MKRKRAKPRAPGTACVAGRRCIAAYEYRGHRYCAKHAADRIFADHVKFQEGRCRRCGGHEDLQWAHVHSRSYGAIRWDRDNSMALCRGCHMYFTNRPLEWEAWCRSTGVPWDVLRERALTHQPMDPIVVIAELANGGADVATG